MRRGLNTVCLAWLMLVLGACVNVHPRYPAESVIWDDSLIGDWRAEGDDNQSILLRIEPREVEIDPDDGRINPDRSPVEYRSSPAGAAQPPTPHSTQQYLLTYTAADSES